MDRDKAEEAARQRIDRAVSAARAKARTWSEMDPSTGVIPGEAVKQIATEAIEAMGFDALREEIDRLRTEGTPGVMHEVDHAFYRLAIDQRDRAWQEVEGLKAKLAEAHEKSLALSRKIEEQQRTLDAVGGS